MKKFLGTLKETLVQTIEGNFIENSPFKSGTKTSKMPTRTITYEVDGRKVICSIKTEDFTARGVARCHPKDIFNVAEGCGLAELRARQDFYKKVEEEYIDMISNPFAQMLKAMKQSLE